MSIHYKVSIKAVDKPEKPDHSRYSIGSVNEDGLIKGFEYSASGEDTCREIVLSYVRSNFNHIMNRQFSIPVERKIHLWVEYSSYDKLNQELVDWAYRYCPKVDLSIVHNNPHLDIPPDIFTQPLTSYYLLFLKYNHLLHDIKVTSWQDTVKEVVFTLQRRHWNNPTIPCMSMYPVWYAETTGKDFDWSTRELNVTGIAEYVKDLLVESKEHFDIFMEYLKFLGLDENLKQIGIGRENNASMYQLNEKYYPSKEKIKWM